MRRFLFMCVACMRDVREWSRCSPLHPAAPLRAAPATKSSRDSPPRPRRATLHNALVSARDGLPRTRCATFSTKPPRPRLARPPCPTAHCRAHGKLIHVTEPPPAGADCKPALCARAGRARPAAQRAMSLCQPLPTERERAAGVKARLPLDRPSAAHPIRGWAATRQGLARWGTHLTRAKVRNHTMPRSA